MHPNGGENQHSGEKQPQIEFRPQTGETDAPVATEKIPVASPENSPQKQSPQAVSQAASDLALPATAIMTSDDQTVPAVTADDTSATANDGDRIEKEWIDRAKTVIARTKDDPFEQKNAMSQVKAEYIRKRFNKTVRTDDTVK
jgi:hypothetical protein